uniref:K Homology domain-containing protein n=1 Tax=Ditylenchus dipsaci TaxID=166011 RepID=A0A915DE84_9BILA
MLVTLGKRACDVCLLLRFRQKAYAPEDKYSVEMTRILLPGDFVTASLRSATNEEKVIGSGLEKRPDGIYSIVPGMLHEKENKLWVVTSIKRYIPHAGDRVLGVVSARAGDYFRVDIGAPIMLYSALLLSRVLPSEIAQVFVSQFEPEMSCVDTEGRARGMGVITTPGLVFSVTLNYARRLISTEDDFLASLGKRIKFEVTVGMNGKICSKKNQRVKAARKTRKQPSQLRCCEGVANCVRTGTRTCHGCFLNCAEVEQLSELTKSFFQCLRTEFPDVSVTSKAYLLCSHVVSFVRCHGFWRIIFEESVESLHRKRRVLASTTRPSFSKVVCQQLTKT